MIAVPQALRSSGDEMVRLAKPLRDNVAELIKSVDEFNAIIDTTDPRHSRLLLRLQPDLDQGADGEPRACPMIPPIGPGVKPLHLGSPHRAVLWDRYGAVWLCGNASLFSRADPRVIRCGYSHPTAIFRGRGLPF